MVIAWRSSIRDTRVNWGLSAPSIVTGVAPSITTTAAVEGAVGEAYVQPLLATGDAPIVWDVDVGSALPVWLSIDGDRLAGVPLEPGLYEFTLTATNDYGTDSQALSILVPNEMSGGGEITEDSLSGSRILTPTPATYTVTGGTVQLQFSPGATTYTLDPETGTFTVTGNPVAFELQERPTPQWQVVISVQSPNWTITDT